MTVEPTTPPRSGTDAPSVPLPRTPPDEPAARQPRRLPRWLRWLPHYRWSGTAAAVLLGGSSFTPSLLPRGWLLQGLIAGITAAVGYVIGIVVAWFVREVTDRRPSPLVRLRAWQVLGVLGTIYLLVLLWLGHRWQAQIHQLMGLKSPGGYQSAGIVVLAVLVFALLVGHGDPGAGHPGGRVWYNPAPGSAAPSGSPKA